MPSQIRKILKLPVGSYKDDNDKVKTEYREIGRLIEHTDQEGNAWGSISLNLDILNPVLFQMAKPQTKPGSATVMVRLYDLPKRAKSNTDEEAPPPDADDDEEGPY